MTAVAFSAPTVFVDVVLFPIMASTLHMRTPGLGANQGPSNTNTPGDCYPHQSAPWSSSPWPTPRRLRMGSQVQPSRAPVRVVHRARVWVVASPYAEGEYTYGLGRLCLAKRLPVRNGSNFPRLEHAQLPERPSTRAGAAGTMRSYRDTAKEREQHHGTYRHRTHVQ